MSMRVSVAKAKAGLSAIMSEVAYAGQHVIIERRGKPFVALVSVNDLELIERERAASARPHGVLGLVGAWGELEDRDVDALIADIYTRREGDAVRRVEIEG